MLNGVARRLESSGDDYIIQTLYQYLFDVTSIVDKKKNNITSLLLLSLLIVVTFTIIVFHFIENLGKFKLRIKNV